MRHLRGGALGRHPRARRAPGDAGATRERDALGQAQHLHRHRLLVEAAADRHAHRPEIEHRRGPRAGLRHPRARRRDHVAAGGERGIARGDLPQHLLEVECARRARRGRRGQQRQREGERGERRAGSGHRVPLLSSSRPAPGGRAAPGSGPAPCGTRPDGVRRASRPGAMAPECHGIEGADCDGCGTPGETGRGADGIVSAGDARERAAARRSAVR